MINITIPDDIKGRLDRVLAEILKKDGISRTMISRLIAAGSIRGKGFLAKPSAIVAPGMKVEIDLPEPKNLDVIPEKIEINLLYEDEDIIAIEKPSGMVIHPSRGHNSSTLVNAVLGLGRNLSGIGGVGRPGIVHRLDKETSGVLLIAKNDRAHRGLSEQFASHAIFKEYKAIIWGHLKFQGMKIDAPIGRNTKDRKKMAVIDGGRSAITNIKVIEEYIHFSYISAIPETGRTHQIRVHLQHIHHPILGDYAYGGHLERGLPRKILRNEFSELNRFFLHAYSIRFKHPISGKNMEMVSPLPEDFVKILEEIKNE